MESILWLLKNSGSEEGKSAGRPSTSGTTQRLGTPAVADTPETVGTPASHEILQKFKEIVIAGEKIVKKTYKK